MKFPLWNPFLASSTISVNQSDPNLTPERPGSSVAVRPDCTAAVRVSVIPIFSSPRRLLWRAVEIFSTALSVSESVHHLWRYRCNAERLAAAENEVDKEDGGRDTF
jgi:hypothetical protein